MSHHIRVYENSHCTCSRSTTAKSQCKTRITLLVLEIHIGSRKETIILGLGMRASTYATVSFVFQHTLIPKDCCVIRGFKPFPNLGMIEFFPRFKCEITVPQRTHLDENIILDGSKGFTQETQWFFTPSCLTTHMYHIYILYHFYNAILLMLIPQIVTTRACFPQCSLTFT